MKLNQVTLCALALSLGTVALPALATAPSYDVSEATPYFTALIAAITVIGGVKLAPAAVAVGFKWLKATIFS